ncbi:hypothetical protein [Streptomyces sp. NPDC001401]|uniref:hypothetical protein n=1 Tax=Streptomyces sp. NPDC001401 TaxID=3364570 RepID=UPI0036D1B3FA
MLFGGVLESWPTVAPTRATVGAICDAGTLEVVFVVASDLRKVADALPALASRHGLQLISASVGGDAGLRAVLGQDRYDAGGVAQLATACGARILYWDLDHFDADNFAFLPTDGEDGEDDPAPAAGNGLSPALRQRADTLLAAAQRHDGEVEAVRIAFVVEGVVHEWEMSAPWAGDLHARWEVLGDDIDQAQPARPELDAPDPAEVERIAALLQKMPAIIAAGSYGQRREAADEAFPAPGGEDDWLHHRLLRQALSLAQQAIQQDGADAYRTIENTLDETAARLLEQGVLDDVHDAPARRIVTTDFLTALTGGHRPKPRTVTLLLGRPAVKDFLTTQKAAAKHQVQPVLPL